MAGYIITQFDWDAFTAAIARPAAEAGEAAAKYVAAHRDARLSTFPKKKGALPAALGALLSSDDWYGDLDDEDAERLDQIVDAIFRGSINLKGMKLKPINNGVYFDVVDVIRGRMEIDTNRSRPEPGGTFFKLTRTENHAVTELQDFGMRPFRHAEWDRHAVQEADAFLGGSGYHPMYSIHSPEQVAQLLKEAKRGAELFAGIEDSELIEGYEEELVRPLADAARVGRAVYVGTDT